MDKNTTNRIRQNISIGKYNKGYDLLLPKEKLDVMEELIFILQEELLEAERQSTFDDQLNILAIIIVSAVIIATVFYSW